MRILCPNLPKEYIEKAKQALGTNDENTVNATFVQWCQHNDKYDELPNVHELVQYNTAIREGHKIGTYSPENNDIRYNISPESNLTKFLKQHIFKVSFPVSDRWNKTEFKKLAQAWLSNDNEVWLIKLPRLENKKIVTDTILAEQAVEEYLKSIGLDGVFHTEWVYDGNQRRTGTKLVLNRERINDTIELHNTLIDLQNASQNSLLNFLSKRLGVEYKQISVSEAKQLLGEKYNSKINAFNLNGVAYFIKGRVINSDITSEEMLHPFIASLHKFQPEIFSDLLNDARSNYSKLHLEIRNTYKESEVDEELVTQALARAFVEERQKNPKPRIKEFIDKFLKGIAKIFSSEPTLKFDKFTLDDIAKLINSDVELKYKKLQDYLRLNQLDLFADQQQEQLPQFEYARTAKGKPGYEVSSQGDKRFSAKTATFKEGTILFGHNVGGRTIESVYQHGVKQNDWKTNNNNKTGASKNKEIITGTTEDDSYKQGYLPLWQEWAKQNPELIEELRTLAQGKVLTDKFASTKVSQARALAEILNSTTPQQQEQVEEPVIETKKEEELQNDDTYAEKIEKLAANDEARKEMFQTMPAEYVYDAARSIAKLYNQIVEKELEKAYNNPEKAKKLTGDKWKDKAIITTNNIDEILRRVKKIIKDKYENETDEGTKDLLSDIYKYFDYIANIAATDLKYNQPVSIKTKEQSTYNIDDETIQQIAQQIQDDLPLEHWQINHLEQSVLNDLSPIVKDILSSIVDENDVDNIGIKNNKQLSSVVQELVETIGSCHSSKSMIPSLQKLAEKQPYVQQILDILCGKNIEAYKMYFDSQTEDDKKRICKNLQALFWKDLHKPFIKICTLETTDKGVKFKVENENDNSSSETLMSIGDAILTESDDNTIYDDGGVINKEKYDKIHKLVHENNKLYNILTSLLENPTINEEDLTYVHNILHSVGVNIDKGRLGLIIASSTKNQIESLRSALCNGIFNKNQSVNKALNGLLENKKEHKSNKRTPVQSVFSGFYQSYISINNFLNTDTKKERQVTVGVDGKNKRLFSNVIPNPILTFFSHIHDLSSVKEFIENEFLYDFHFKDRHGKIPNIWLRELYEDSTHNSRTDVAQLVASDGISYSKENGQQSKRTRFNTYQSSKESVNGITYAYYSMPTFADGKASYYIRQKVRGYNECIDAITDMFMVELDRLSYINAKEKAIERTANEDYSERIYAIEFFDSRKQFVMFNSLNVDETLTRINSVTDDKKREECKNIVKEQMAKEFQLFRNEYFGISDNEQELNEYFYNQFLANICTDNIFMVDDAFCKNDDDKQKRMKRCYSPTQTAYTSLYMYDESGQIKEVVDSNERKDEYGNPVEFSIILADNILRSVTMDQVSEELQNAVNEKRLTKNQYETIMSGMKEIKMTDGQTYRTLQSWRDFMHMIGEGLNKQGQEAIDRILNGTWSYQDMQFTLTLVKPLVSTDVKTRTHLTAEDFNNPMMTEEDVARFESMKIPQMHKNAELILLAQYACLDGIMKKSPKLVALDEFMTEIGIDKALFHSANKIGNQGIIDINIEVYGTFEDGKFINETGKEVKPSTTRLYINSETGNYYRYNKESGNYIPISLNTVKNYYKELLRTYCGIDKEAKGIIQYGTGYNDQVITASKKENWGVITDLPEHLLTHEEGGISTQMIKIISEDLDDGAQITINLNGNNETLTGEEAKSLFQDLLADYVIRKLQEVEPKFKNPVLFKEFVQSALARQGKDSEDLINCLEIDSKTGMFKLSPLNPIRNQKFLSFCTSLVRKEVIKHNAKQGLLPQIANFGFEYDLAMRYKNAEGKMIFTPKEFTDKSGDSLVDKRYSDYLKEMQKKYDSYKKYKASKDAKAKSLLYLEGAVPMYDKKFMGFVDQQSGQLNEGLFNASTSQDCRDSVGNRTPAEGKHSIIPVYFKYFLPYTNASTVMMAADWVFLSGSDMDSDKLFLLMYELAETTDKKTGMTRLFPKNFKPSEVGETLAERLKNGIASNDLASCNNLLLSLMRGILQSDENLTHILTPNGFEELRRITYIDEIVESSSYENNIESLEKMSIERLKELLPEKKNKPSIYNPVIRSEEQTRNMTGLNSVAILAVYRAFLPLLQKVDAKTTDPLVLNGNKSLGDTKYKLGSHSISRIKNNLDIFISDLSTMTIAAAVDNAKDPLLEKYGITTDLIPHYMFLIAKGYGLTEISLFFKQPCIQACLTNSQENGTTLRSEVTKMMGEMAKHANITSARLTQAELDLSLSFLASEVHAQANGKPLNYPFESHVLNMFSTIFNAVEEMNTIASLCRNSTFSGAISSTDAEYLKKYIDLQDALRKYRNYNGDRAANEPIQGLSDLIATDVDKFEHTLQQKILVRAPEIFRNTSIVLSNNFVDFISNVSKETGKKLSAQEIQAIKNHVISYVYARHYLDVENPYGNNPFMGLYEKLLNFTKERYRSAEQNIELSNDVVQKMMFGIVPQLISYFKKRGILNNQDEIFDLLKLTKNKFLGDALTIDIPGKKKNDVINEKVRIAWQQLLDNAEEKHVIYEDTSHGEISFTNEDIANLLFLYNLQMSGAYPNSNNFLDLMPYGYESEIPNYSDITNSLRTVEFKKEALINYVMNHARDTKLFKTITTDNSTVKKFMGTAVIATPRGNQQMMVAPDIIKVPANRSNTFLSEFGTISPFIKIDEKIEGEKTGRSVYYLLTSDINDYSNITYTRFVPKGSYNVIEYFNELETFLYGNNLKDSLTVANQTVINTISQINATSENNDVNLQNETDDKTKVALGNFFGENVEVKLVSTNSSTNENTDESGQKICALIK